MNFDLVKKMRINAARERSNRRYYSTQRNAEMAEKLFKMALAVALLLLIIGQVMASMDFAEDDQHVNEILARCMAGKAQVLDGRVLECKPVAK